MLTLSFGSAVARCRACHDVCVVCVVVLFPPELLAVVEGACFPGCIECSRHVVKIFTEVFSFQRKVVAPGVCMCCLIDDDDRNMRYCRKSLQGKQT